MEKEPTECFDTENSGFAVEVPSKQHNLPEVKEAKEKEIQNLTNLGYFREVKYNGNQKPLGSRWVITKKEKHDGLKSDYKGKIVVRGFQETDSPASESPTVQR